MRLEILHQRRAGLVNLMCHLVEVLGEGFARAAVAVPVRVVQLHKPRPTLHEAARQEAVVCIAWFARLDAVQIERRFGFAGEIHQLRRAGLHAVRHLVGGDARVDLRVTGGHQPLQVESVDDVDRGALASGGDAGRVGQVQDRVARAAQRHALICGRQKTARPVGRPAARAARTGMQHHEPRQALRLAADAVRHPGAHARPPEDPGAGVHEQLGRRVVEQVGLAGAEHRHLVGDAGDVWDVGAEPHARLAVLTELFHRAKQFFLILERAVHEGKPLALDERLGDVATVAPGQFRLPVEQLQL